MNGLILLDKPSGMTSFAAAAKLRRIYGEKRVGHTGTLDPMATGVLPILLGRATRLSGFVLDADKRYRAVFELGKTTDTLDITGKTLSVSEVNVGEEDVKKALSSFLGEISQIPPMFSALKKDGVRLYDLARQGVSVERPARRVNIKELNLIKALPQNRYEIDCLCSKGTYIRSLCDDIGASLGCGAVLCELRRTETAGFSINDCVGFQKLEENPDLFLKSADTAVPQFEKVYITENQRTRFLHGGALSLDRLRLPSDNCEYYKVMFGEEFLGLGVRNDERGELAVKCIITD